MDKKYWIVGLVVVLVVVMIISWGGRESEDLEISEVCYGATCFQVEVADTQEERAKGLMFRESLCDSCGMLFVYDEEGDYKFWMKNTLIPLDIIWLDSDLKVVYVANAVPCVTDGCELYGPSRGIESRYVLEVNRRVVEGIGLGVGDGMEFVYG